MLFTYLQGKGASKELAELIVEMAQAVEEISTTLIRTGTGKAGAKNAYGEEQIKMDTVAEEIVSRYLKECPYVASYCSEELDKLEKGAFECKCGKVGDLCTCDGAFSVFYDPLDGSSLFDVNLSVGTIVGIYKGADVIGSTPRKQVGALYAVYGPKTTLVISVGNGVHEFTLSCARECGVGGCGDGCACGGGFELTCDSMKLDGKKKYFAPGNLRATAEREDYFKLVTEMMREQYTLRYSGGMVPDVNHILKKGSGVFMYPGMPSQPDGKLRLLYECGPLAYLMEQAGGASSNGERSILDVEIKSLTQKTPIFLGTKSDVERVVSALG